MHNPYHLQESESECRLKLCRWHVNVHVHTGISYHIKEGGDRDFFTRRRLGCCDIKMINSRKISTEDGGWTIRNNAQIFTGPSFDCFDLKIQVLVIERRLLRFEDPGPLNLFTLEGERAAAFVRV
uniref:Uncharacterized protein n=1 Tax=Opuntia streptacantha TaxID=393608 RepID=A0A7C9AT90_OPUST